MAKTDGLNGLKLYRKKCLDIVESFLTEEVVSADVVIDKCHYITRNYYSDIVDERVLIDLCGYPICQKKLSANKDKFRVKANQKFKIDAKNNKIYEIEERKNFCSDLCYKSSNYLKEQISEEPVFLRTGPQKKIHLYDQNVSQTGEEVVFDEELVRQMKLEMRPKVETNDTNKKSSVKEKAKQSIGFPYIRKEDLNELRDQMNGLNISEHYDQKEVLSDLDEESESDDECREEDREVEN